MGINDDFYISTSAPESFSRPIEINGAVRASIAVTQGTGFTWGTAVIEIEHTVDPDRLRWHSFVPAVTISDSQRSNPRIPTAGILALRLRTTTASGGSDGAAQYDFSLTMPDGKVVVG